MIVEFAKGMDWLEIKKVLSMFEKDYIITLYCASTWQTTNTGDKYTAFDCLKKGEKQK